MQIAILRHGATESNDLKLYTGRTDVALSEGGERQVQEVGVRPEVSKVYVSPMRRARRTAELCFPNAEQVVVDGLREMDFGDFEGRSAKEMEHDRDYCAWLDSMCETQCPNGESRAEFAARTCSAIDNIIREALENNEENVIVVGHGGTIMASMDGYANDERSYFDWHVGNCEGYRAQVIIADEKLIFEDPQFFFDFEFMKEEGSWLKMPEWKHPNSFFSNTECDYFPCHEGVPEDEFNCMFCYCPLYALGPNCGGNFVYTKKGKKSCINCTLPHVKDHGAKLVTARYHLLAKLAERKDQE